ncbi:VWA domain-containing protein [Crassaminicella profunda]|uniref:VWA domain-containing protein n=1 Tax=Crassaminicella profunda TaxID=1286698 RepID=UPI001CA6F79E|nr:VWA domain-containing protein [Crassaminicella profunda]QZY56105.1 VWA domain-containing protein [Crassaminicella profunda]
MVTINFNDPILLLLIPFSLIFLFYFVRNGKMEKRRKNRLFLMRSLIIILTILSLSGLHIKSYVDQVTTIFAVDLSESTLKNKDDFKAFIEESLKYTSKNDQVGVLTFGKEIQIETSLSDTIKNIEFQTNPGKNYTNIENALKISRSIIPEESRKRIVLLSDGEENIGNSMNEAFLMKEENIDFKVLKLNKNIGKEVQLSSVEVPKILYENQSFGIKINIWSNIATNVKIKLYSGRSLVGEKEVFVQKGENSFVFKDVAKSNGFGSYKVVIDPKQDTNMENNTYETYTEVQGKPKILLIDGESNGGRELSKILKSAALDVNTIKAQQAPQNIAELSKYKTVIMCDVSLENIHSEFINALKAYVRDYGGGLFVTGGENSFALGGYYKTPLEEILPVDMEMKVKGKVPNLGLMLVIDKSGSMESGQYGLSKINIAKEAAIKAVHSLKSKDKIGVIAFDGAAQWVVPLSSVDDEENIKRSIGTIRAGGGTSIVPALDEAYNALKDTDTKLKHIILLTDGQAERYGYTSLIEEMKKKGITISTVAVGEGADTSLLEGIAKSGRGRYYFVDEFSTIPQIFTKETFLASKSYINNRTFTPKVGIFHDILNPLAGNIPDLGGYIGSCAKPRARILLVSDKEDPILSIWQYGLGKSVAWTSDVNGKWTKNYLHSDEGIKFFKNMVEWTFSKNENNRLQVDTNSTGKKGEIIVKNIGNFEEGYKAKATIITPSLEKIEMKLDPISPGTYKNEFASLEKGIYMINVNQYKGDKLVNTKKQGMVVNYSKEYDFADRKNNLEGLVYQTGGMFIERPEEVFAKDLDPVYGSKDLSRMLMIIALILFVIDIALRRLNIRWKRFKLIENNISKKVSKVPFNVKPSKNNSIKDPIDEDKKEEKKTVKIKEHERKGKTIDTSRLLKAKDKRKR